MEAVLRRSHVRSQLVRFVRLAAVTFVAQLGVAGSGHLSRDVLVAAAVGAAEAAVRQVWPVVPWAAVKAAPAVDGARVVPPGGVS